MTPPDNDAGVFNNSLSRKVRAEFEAALRAGHSPYAAADAILSRHAAQLHDAGTASEVLYAVATLQLEQGVISPKIRKLVLTLIVSGEGLHAFASRGQDWLAARNEVEQDLRRRLGEIG